MELRDRTGRAWQLGDRVKWRVMPAVLGTVMATADKSHLHVGVDWDGAMHIDWCEPDEIEFIEANPDWEMQQRVIRTMRTALEGHHQKVSGGISWYVDDVAIDCDADEVYRVLADALMDARLVQMPPVDREGLGRRVRDVWLEWASEQPGPELSWLTPWEELTESEREVDRRIGEALAASVYAGPEVGVLRSRIDAALGWLDGKHTGFACSEQCCCSFGVVRAALLGREEEVG